MSGCSRFLIALMLSFFSVPAGLAHAMQPCESPDIDQYELVLRVAPVSSTVIQEELHKIRQSLLANKEEEWNEETIEVWFGNPTVSKLRVLETYKGDAPPELDVHHASKSITGLDFLSDKEYLVHLNEEKAEPYPYQVGGCTADIIDEANPSAIYLRAKHYKGSTAENP